MSLVLTHAKFHFLETVRIPMAVIGTAFFPTASMLFFVVPFAGNDPVASTFATGSMVVFATMAACLFQYGIGVAEDRIQPWEPFTRTLPAGPGPRFFGRILNVGLMTLLALVPVLLVAALFTEATISPVRLALGVVALLATAVPFTFMGLSIGYALPPKAAIPTAQIVFFPMGFGGGLFFGSPEHAPEFLNQVAPYLPTRGGVELLWAATTNFQPRALSLVMLVMWTIGAAGLALWAFRRDQGQRYS
jgi:ABC-2 type transport system permease protein